MFRVTALIKKERFVFLLLIPLFLIYYFLYKIYIPKVNAFGCFDDCFNIVAGYFLSSGKRLYSEIFFNHQPFMPHISYFIQILSNPINIFELILRHRQFVLIFSFLMNTFLIWRLGFWLFGFVLFYEFSKFYVFGDRFLAEGFVVYPLVYMFGLVFQKYSGEKLYLFDYFLTGVFVWFVIFMREPFVPLALVLFAFVFWNKTFEKKRTYVFFVFPVLTLFTIILLPLKEYLFNVVSINYSAIFSQEVSEHNLFGLGIVKIFLYQFFILFNGEWNEFRKLLFEMALMFSLFSILLVFKKKWKLLFLTIFILGLANFRVVVPGKIFYAAFHMIPWYGMFIASIFFFLKYLYSFNKRLIIVQILILVVLFVSFILNKESFIYKGVDPHYEFITNYGRELQAGEAIRILSNSSDTLFVDGFDDLIYWQAKRPSPYRYSWYTSLMPNIDLYREERLRMFSSNPPDFYYGSCPKEQRKDLILPTRMIGEYKRLYMDNKPSCLFVKKTKIKDISSGKWKKAKEFLVSLPQ